MPRYFYHGGLYNELPIEVRRAPSRAVNREIVQADGLDLSKPEVLADVKRQVTESAVLLKLPSEYKLVRRAIYELLRNTLKGIGLTSSGLTSTP